MRKLLLPLPIGFILSVLSPAIAHSLWVQKAHIGGDARHRCTGFAVGNKGYIGGGHINSGESLYYSDYWQYDPGTNSWSQIADFGGGERYHATAFTIGNIAYVGLGENNSNEYQNDFWRYIPLTNTWEPIATYPGIPRRGACSFVINDEGYVGTGQSDLGYLTDFYKYDASNNSWTQIADFSGEARNSAVAFSYNGKGYVGTGHILGDDMNDFWEYDPMSNSWLQKADVGPTPRQDATGFVLNGYAYIGTGNDNEGEFNFNDFWQYDFNSDTWTEIDEFDGFGRRYMVSFTIGDVAYCGSGTNGTNLKDFWAFYPLLDEDKIEEEKLDLYFRHENSAIIISGNFDEEDEIIVQSLDGKIVLNQNAQEEIVTDTDMLSTGILIVSYFRKNERMLTKKIQIVR